MQNANIYRGIRGISAVDVSHVLTLHWVVPLGRQRADNGTSFLQILFLLCKFKLFAFLHPPAANWKTMDQRSRFTYLDRNLPFLTVLVRTPVVWSDLEAFVVMWHMSKHLFFIACWLHKPTQQPLTSLLSNLYLPSVFHRGVHFGNEHNI